MSVTCIGLDIAWFGGSKSNLESQADCVAAVHINETGKTRFEINRVNLNSHDLSSLQIYGAITQIITRTASDQTRIVIAIDAPLQSAGHEDLPAMREIGGPVARRACENYLSKHRQEIDEAARGSAGWQPNIQPGAPIAPRISNLLTILQESGFAVWIPQNNDSPRTVIEAFPAEAIWAVKRQGGYPDNITAADAKKYKAKEISHQQLTEGNRCHCSHNFRRI